MADAEGAAPEAPGGEDAPAADAPAADAPAADAPAADAPAADAAADAPVADAPAADAPAEPSADAGAADATAPASDAAAEASAEMPAASVTVPVEKVVEVTAVPRSPVVYIEAMEGQTRVVLLQDKGDRISVRDVGVSLDPLKDLGAGKEDEDAAALLQRRKEFADFLGSILETAKEVIQGHKNPEVVLGLSSWYTDLPDEDKASYEGMWDSLRQQVRQHLADDAVLVLLPLVEDEEARHEHRAVAFAATQVQRLKPDFAGLVLGSSVPDSGKLRCTCGFAADSPVLRVALSLEEGGPMVEGEDGIAKWQSQCKEKCTETFSASKDVIAGVCEKAAAPQVCVLAGLLQGIQAPAALLGQQEVKEALEKLEAALGDASAADKAAILRTAAALEALEGVVGSSLQVLFSEKWELGGSSFNASWSVGHYLKRPQGTKEVAQTDGPPPTPSEAAPAAETTEKEGPSGKTEAATVDVTTSDPSGQATSETVQATATAEDPENPEAPMPTGMEEFRPNEPEPKARIGPGFVVYIVAPNDDMPLSGADFSAIRSAAVQSDATVVLSARSASGLVIEEGKKVAESNRVLRPLADFAVRRFSPAGSSKAGSHQSAFQHLFEAIVLSGKEAVYRSVVEGLQNLGFPGDTAATAEALLPVGIPKVTKQEFCSSLADAFVHPEMVVVCPKNSKGAAEWPQVRTVHFPGTDMTGEAALKTKVAEAWKAAGRGGHGVILVLAARGRCSMAPADYERQMRQELKVAMEGLPSRWPLLWAPGPAEVGLFPIGCKQRSNWAMQQAYLAELPGWLRYLLIIRPNKL